MYVTFIQRDHMKERDEAEYLLVLPKQVNWESEIRLSETEHMCLSVFSGMWNVNVFGWIQLTLHTIE